MPYGSKYRRAPRRNGRFRKRVATGNTKVPYKKVVRKYKNKLFNARVESVINRHAETKMKVTTLTATQHQIQGSGLRIALNGNPRRGILWRELLYDITPLRVKTNASASDFNSQESRIGNKIQNVTVDFRGLIKSLPFNDSTNYLSSPFEVHMVVYKEKSGVANSPDGILTYPNNAQGRIDNVTSTLYPWNKNGYVIYKHRVWKMRSMPEILVENADDHNVINPQTSNFPSFRRFRQRINFGSTWLYNDNDRRPRNVWGCVAFYVINGDGTDLNGGTQQIRASCYLDATVKFKDY